jgi:hypothetical protein
MHMTNDMKLVELLPVGKIEPRKPINEIVGVELLPNKKAVELTIDDSVLHIHPGAGIKDINALQQLVAALVLNQVFKSAMYEANVKRHVDEIQISLTKDGLRFSSI